MNSMSLCKTGPKPKPPLLMKRILLFTALVVLFCTPSRSQAPNAFNYQAVARNASGDPLANQVVSFRISILSGSSVGPTVFSETHVATTNGHGIANLRIGQGTLVSGAFASINWSGAQHYVKVELDPLGGSSFTNMGISQLVSVPYAKFAETSGSSIWGLNGSNTFYNGGNVGIGDDTPAASLTVGNGDKLQIHGSDGDIVFTDDEGSLRFANVSGTSAPMIQMFQTGTNNPTRMFLAHSPAFPNWGIQYNDTSDAFTWIGDNIPVFQVQLAGQQRVGVGTFNPTAKFHVSTNSATGTGHIKLTETQLDYSRITMNNNIHANFWDLAAITDTNLTNATFNVFHSDAGDILSVNARKRVGINDNTPAYPLEINGNGETRGLNLYNTLPTTTSSTFNYGVIVNMAQAANTGFPRLFNLYGFSTDADAYLSYGCYGFASNASNFNYGVYGVAGTTLGYAGYFSGNTYCSGSYVTSDEKFKKDIVPIKNGLDVVLSLKPRSYTYDTRTFDYMNLSEGTQYGFLAQEVEQVLPSLVKYSFQGFEEDRIGTGAGEQGIEFKALNYDGIIPILVSGMQEQQQLIDAQQKLIQALESRLAALEARK